MFAMRIIRYLLTGVLTIAASSCFIGYYTDDDGHSPCDCDESHAACVIDCGTDACVAGCDSSRDECKRDCR